MTPEQMQIFTEIRIAEYFPGWTLDYIRSLPLADLQAIFAVKTATSKYKDEESRKSSQRGQGL